MFVPSVEFGPVLDDRSPAMQLMVRHTGLTGQVRRKADVTIAAEGVQRELDTSRRRSSADSEVLVNTVARLAAGWLRVAAA